MKNDLSELVEEIKVELYRAGEYISAVGSMMDQAERLITALEHDLQHGWDK
jgi:hypothetical protein